MYYSAEIRSLAYLIFSYRFSREPLGRSEERGDLFL